MKSIQSVLCFFFAASLLLTSCSTSNHQSNASAELSMIGENGEHIPVEPVVTDASLTDRALEVSSQLVAPHPLGWGKRQFSRHGSCKQ